MAMPDVFSIRHTTVEAYAEPIVHEVKVQRADLLADLRRACKRQAYLELGGECWYVIKEGIAARRRDPAECGVLVASDAASRWRGRRRSGRPGSASQLWMALARATPVDGLAPRRRADAARRHFGADAAWPAASLTVR